MKLFINLGLSLALEKDHWGDPDWSCLPRIKNVWIENLYCKMTLLLEFFLEKKIIFLGQYEKIIENLQRLAKQMLREEKI